MLGNNCPKILLQLEDCVLQAIMALSDGTSREKAMDTLYSEILALKNDLANDEIALSWFDLSRALSGFPSTPPKSGFSSSDLVDDPFAVSKDLSKGQVPQLFNDAFHGVFSFFKSEPI